MRKIIYICDKCGKEITEDIIEMQAGQLDPENESWEQMPALKVHFHLTCMDDVLNSLKKEEFAPVQKEGKKPKKTVDRDTVKALYLADWKIKDIAEDPKVKCSEWTVRNIIRELREAGEIK
ncbi:MAG: hypothetical protein IKE31_03750 [Eubacterium sp.]|nr:hypothetical protein [Eubacterium sp.]